MVMGFDEYQQKALSTANPKGTEDSQGMLLNAVLGLSGESGEVADMLKKSWFQGHILDREKMVLELGDILWYLSLGAEALGYTLSEIAQLNVVKLSKRYPTGAFRENDSLNRKELS